MHFEFTGYGEAVVVIDTKEFAELSRDEIARELHDMAMDLQEVHFNDSQFYDAADEVLRELAGA